jgi:hypothetical protein
MAKRKNAYKEVFVHDQDKLVVLDGEREYNVYALLKVIAELQEKLVFEYGENTEKIKYIFEQSGVSKEIFEEFDLSNSVEE